MPEVQKSKAKSSTNWPVLAAAGLCIVFIVGVWVNNYRVSHAAPAVAAVSTPK
jgi:hypothetical protein